MIGKQGIKSTATYKCSSSFTNTNFMTKKQLKYQDFETILETRVHILKTS